MRTYPCPTSWRISHPTEDAADRQRIRDQIKYDAIHQPYLCRCAGWHLTPNLHEELPTYQDARPEDIQRLKHLSAAAFQHIVDGDIKRTARTRDRLALRDPHLHTRWRWALKALLHNVQTQLDETPDAPGWESKALSYEQAVRLRLDECRAYRLHNLQQAA
ncbi:hypothetical protein AB0454_22660 [Streptomyces sp. NPDC093509]|uniref:hypothetical protein n=1 Tax=Streptomyces sp. NPDC093509 TaxID=3154982 RepID=UPI00344C7F27